MAAHGGRVTGSRRGERQEGGGDPLNVLRSLLVGPEQNRIEELQERIEDPGLRAEDISRVLPDAVLLRMAQDDKLGKALAPTIEKAFGESVRRNPRALVEVIAPIMGAAIRKSIFQAISGMVESLNRVLEQSLSVQGIKWRIESMRTGIPFAEILLLKTLIYQVEQVFLIHRETGLLLLHEVAPFANARDADMVSGMLTAIQDFVHDSFGGHPEEGLHSIQVGERVVWVEQGPQMVLAGVIRGSAPQSLRLLFQQGLEAIHLEQRQALSSFAGDAAPFESSRPHLEDCLHSQYREKEAAAKPDKKNRRALLLWGGVIAALAVAAFLGYERVRESQRWDAFLLALHAEPGVVITEAGKREGAYFVTGLRDPMAADPAEHYARAGLAPAPLRQEWEAYRSYHPDLVLRRVREELQPPEGVQLELDEGVLIARGRAPHQWIEEAQRRAPELAGVAAFEARHLVDEGVELVQELARRLGRKAIFFEPGSTRIPPGQEYRLVQVAALIDSLQSACRLPGMAVRILVVGRADPTGPAALNERLGEMRARQVAHLLEVQGVPGQVLGVRSEARRQALPGESELDHSIERRVGFEVLVQGAP